MCERRISTTSVTGYFKIIFKECTRRLFNRIAACTIIAPRNILLLCYEFNYRIQYACLHNGIDFWLGFWLCLLAGTNIVLKNDTTYRTDNHILKKREWKQLP
jgi:hypothetical protein